jgi:hypothetical protein
MARCASPRSRGGLPPRSPGVPDARQASGRGGPTRLPSLDIGFVEPAFPNSRCRFIAALASVGGHVAPVGESPEKVHGGRSLSVCEAPAAPTPEVP